MQICCFMCDPVFIITGIFCVLVPAGWHPWELEDKGWVSVCFCFSFSSSVTRRVCATCSIRVGLFFLFFFFPDRGQKHGICCGICTTHSVKDSWFQFFNRTTSKKRKEKRERERAHARKRIKAKHSSVSYCNRFVRLSRTMRSHTITFKHISFLNTFWCKRLVRRLLWFSVSVPFPATPDPLKLNCKR